MMTIVVMSVEQCSPNGGNMTRPSCAICIQCWCHSTIPILSAPKVTNWTKFWVSWSKWCNHIWSLNQLTGAKQEDICTNCTDWWSKSTMHQRACTKGDQLDECRAPNGVTITGASTSRAATCLDTTCMTQWRAGGTRSHTAPRPAAPNIGVTQFINGCDIKPHRWLTLAS